MKLKIFLGSLVVILLATTMFFVGKSMSQQEKIDSAKKATQSESSSSESSKKASSSSKSEASSSSESKASSSSSSSASLSSSEAEQLTMAYCNKFQHSGTDYFTPRVKTSDTKDMGDQYSVIVSDTPDHIIPFLVNKETREVTSPNGMYNKERQIGAFRTREADLLQQINNNNPNKSRIYRAGAQAPNSETPYFRHPDAYMLCFVPTDMVDKDQSAGVIMYVRTSDLSIVHYDDEHIPSYLGNLH